MITIKTSYKPTIIVIFIKMILASLFLGLFKNINLELKKSTIVIIIENATTLAEVWQ
ncbi:TPA: hypothetical protein RTG46_000368 [Campylobacter jejuni]|nr:hypothetical protein [Campylobacter jejuni]HDZ5009651.1 hypothetical protein [Campylobacter jejuni]HDZ5010372.1 hypothetical protein [Campylobacter jejuni]HDZ5013980.1 hypothetical protein [Campylobacter jejuni]HDZ5016305.1 hypothetical protein [Campylobacter jejuni]